MAFSLLMAFLFIHVAKAVHRHENTALAFSFDLKVQKSSDCAICDYHITKDADLPLVSFSSTQHTLPAYYTVNAYQSRLTSSIGLSYTDRGPPAVV